MLHFVLWILAIAGLAGVYALLGAVFLFPWAHGWEGNPVLSVIKLARTVVSVIATIYPSRPSATDRGRPDKTRSAGGS